MHPYTFFAEVCRDLQQLTQTGASNYQLTRASGILRLLFLDSSPLVHQINRELRVPLLFEVSPVQANRPLTVPGAALRYTSINPYDLQRTAVKLPAFLKRVAVMVAEEEYSVRNVIKCVAHVGGGIHYLPPEDEREEELIKAAEELMINDQTMLIHAIAEISAVSLAAMEPLLMAARTAP